MVVVRKIEMWRWWRENNRNVVLAVVVVVVIKSCKLSTNLLYYFPSEGKIMIWTLK